MGWLTKVARLLRGEDLDASSAGVIEAVRLAETLAALRGRPVPGLTEMTEAAQTVLCFGNDVPVRLIHDKLIVGEKLGQVPGETPMVPLQQDLARLQKRLRLPPEASQRTLELDLRKRTDLDRSVLLHRLSLLGIPWGQPEGSAGKGTFREIWRIQWQPEFAVAVIENSRWGNTVLDAATAYTQDAAEKAADLPTLTALLGRVLFADLPGAIGRVMERLRNEAAIASDIHHLMDALPPLANTMRYGSVRQIDTTVLAGVIDGLAARVCIGLPNAASSLNDDAARDLFGRIQATHGAFSLLRNDEHLEMWHATLGRMSASQTIHGLISGRATRLLFDAEVVPPDSTATRLSLALSPSNDPTHAAAWVEGFLKGSGLLLLHDQTLWSILDEWVTRLGDESFVRMLPLLRRTFSTFDAAERRQMHERARRGGAAAPIRSSGDAEFDHARAEAVLSILSRLLGAP